VHTRSPTPPMPTHAPVQGGVWPGHGRGIVVHFHFVPENNDEEKPVRPAREAMTQIFGNVTDDL